MAGSWRQAVGQSRPVSALNRAVICQFPLNKNTEKKIAKIKRHAYLGAYSLICGGVGPFILSQLLEEGE